MARQLRIEYEGAFYHITSRGNMRGQIFWDKNDRVKFQDILKRTKDRYKYFLHAYVLMNNHYHLLIETPHSNIKQIMQNINTSYTVYINKRHRRSGHLFQGRYKSFIVDKEGYLLELGRYIHLNPVSAGIVQRADDYKWSSYKEYVEGNAKQKITDTEDTLYLFSKIKADAVRRYREFVYAGMGEDSPLDEAEGSVLGDEGFTGKVLEYLNVYPGKREPIPDIKKIEKRYNLGEVVRIVSRYYEVDDQKLLRRNRTAVRQRKMAIYLCKVLTGEKNIDIGKIFEISAPAISNVIKEIENLKDKSSQVSSEICSIKESIKD